jgi:hypothetical protein
MANIWGVSDPQEYTDKIRQLHPDVGGFGTLLISTHMPDDYSLTQLSLRRLMEEVTSRVWVPE